VKDKPPFPPPEATEVALIRPDPHRRLTMKSTNPIANARRELAHRRNGGMDVTLYWSPGGNSISIEVRQPATEETLTVTIAPEQALDAFYHPFAHLHATFSDAAPALEHA
jgi:hypothetical protein